MPRPVSLRPAVPALYSLALAVVVLGPLLVSPGYLLLRDAVSTPRSFLTDSALGLTDAAARAVPQDALLATASAVVDGGVVVTALLTGALWAAGWGGARLVAVLLPAAGLPARLVAATVFVWNPYVAERLLQGHWSLLVGYAALPWTVVASVAVRRGARSGWASLAVCLGAAGLTPTGALLASVTALAVLAAPGGRSPLLPRLAGAVTLATAVAAPWLVATALSGGAGDGSDPAGVRAFAARAEPALGTLGSVAGLGGIWNADAVPGSRATVWALVGTAALLLVVACGVPALWRRRRNPVLGVLTALAAVAVLGPALAATGTGLRAGAWAMVHVPGAGLLRDTQKWVAWAVPLYALAAAAGVGTVRGRFGGRAGAWATAAALTVLLALPDLAWGVGGRVRPVQYPDAWQRVAAAVPAGAGDVAVLPAGMFRRFEFSGAAPVLDPAPRMLRADVLQSGELIVAGGTVAGEGRGAAEVERLLLAGAAPADLAAHGVGWVLVEHGTPGDLGDSARALEQLEPVFSDAALSLYRVPGVDGTRSDDRTAAIAAHALWVAVSAGGLVGLLVLRRPARRREHHGGLRRAREQS
ncbi:hypothetical protein Q3O43_23595 [Rhodococcus aetherivorans]|uniref:hypothetical protein n=1 Tax=Rhodococcus aetherivorans TaxID=191292 RepID=UPI0026ED99E3|nr:hypothetical protein [Rhodococcus aetherivorans]WKW97977.1 hypothetical protein Q3O43_23595 [Rhodococcus aetherivorans]